MDEQKIKEVFSDEKFVRELFDMEEPEQVQQALHERGVDISRDEVLATREALSKAIENGGELSEDELENIAGGIGAGAVVAIIQVAIAASPLIVLGIIDAVRRRW